MAHVHGHPLVDGLRLDDDLPVSWGQRPAIKLKHFSETIPTFGVPGKARLEEI